MGTEATSPAAAAPRSGSSAVSADYPRRAKAGRRDDEESRACPGSSIPAEALHGNRKSKSHCVEDDSCLAGAPDFPPAAALLGDGFPLFLFTSPSQLVPLEAPVSPRCFDFEDEGPTAEEGTAAENRPPPLFHDYGDSSPFPVSEALFARNTYDVAVVKEAGSSAVHRGPAGTKDRRGDCMISWPPSFPAFLPPGRPIDANATFVAYGLGPSVRLMPIVGSAEDGLGESFKASLQAQLSCSAPAVPAPKPSAVSVSLSQDRRPHFLLVSDSNNLVSVFKVSIPSSPSSVSTSSTTAPRSKASGGASPFLLLQLPKSSCTPDHISPNGCPGSSGSGAPVYVTWVPSSPEAGPASSRQTSKVEGVTGPAFLGGGVFFLTVQSHQVVVWSLPVLRSYCVSQSIMPEKQPLTVDSSVLSHCACTLPLREAWTAARAFEKHRQESGASSAVAPGAVSPPFGQSASSTSSLPTFPASSSHPSLFSASAFLGVRGGPGFSLPHMRTALGGGGNPTAGDFTVQAVTFCPFSGCLLVGFDENCVAAWRISSTQDMAPRCELVAAQLLPVGPVPPGMCVLDASLSSPSATSSASAGPREASASEGTTLLEHAGPLSNPFDQFFLNAGKDAQGKTESQRPASPSKGGKAQSASGGVLRPAMQDTEGPMMRHGDSSLSGKVSQSLTSISSLHVLCASSTCEAESEDDAVAGGRAEGRAGGRRRAFLLVGSARNCCLRVFPLSLLRTNESSGQAPSSTLHSPRMPLVGPCVQTLLLNVGGPPPETRQGKFDGGTRLPWAFVRVDPAQRMVMWSVSGCEWTGAHRGTRQLRKGGLEKELSSDAPERGREASSGAAVSGDSERESGSISFVFLMEVNQHLVANDASGQGSAGRTVPARSTDASSRLCQAARLPLPSLLAIPSKRPIASVSSIFALYRPKNQGGSTGPGAHSGLDEKGSLRAVSSSASSPDFEFETLEPGELVIYSFCVKKAGDGATHELVQGHSDRTLQELYRQPSIHWVSRSADAPRPGAVADSQEDDREDSRGEARDDVTPSGKRECTDQAGEAKKREWPDVEQHTLQNAAPLSESRKEEGPVCAAPPQSASPVPENQSVASNDKASRTILMMLLGRGRAGASGSQTVSSTAGTSLDASSASPTETTPHPVKSADAGQPPKLRGCPGEVFPVVEQKQSGFCSSTGIAASWTHPLGGPPVSGQEAGELTASGDFRSEGQRREERKGPGVESITLDFTATQAEPAHVFSSREVPATQGEQRPAVLSETLGAEQLDDPKTPGARGAASGVPATKKEFEGAIADALQMMGDSLSDKIEALAPALASNITAALVGCSQLHGSTSASKQDPEVQKEALLAVLTPVVVAELTRQFSQYVVPGMKEAVRVGLADVKAVVAAEMAEFRRQAALENGAVDQSLHHLQTQLQQGLQRLQAQLPQQSASQRQNGAQNADAFKQAVAGIDEALKSQSELIAKQLDVVAKSLSAVQRQQSQQQQSVNQLLGQQTQQQQSLQKFSSTQTQQLQHLTSQSAQQQQAVQQVLSLQSQCSQDMQQIAKRQAKHEQSLHGYAQALDQLVQLNKQFQADLQRVEQALQSARTATPHRRSQLLGLLPGTQGENSPLNETEQLRRCLFEELHQHKYEDAFSQAIAADIEQNTGGGWVLMLCNSLHPGKFFERDPLPLGQAALVGTVKSSDNGVFYDVTSGAAATASGTRLSQSQPLSRKDVSEPMKLSHRALMQVNGAVWGPVLSEGLQEDLMQRRKATVQQRVAWISEALFQIAGPLPQMCRSDFLDLVEEFRTNLTSAQQQLQKPDFAELFPRSINDDITVCVKQLKRLQRAPDSSNMTTP